VNNGAVTINNGATLNLTNQPNGITDVVAGSNLTVAGTFKAGANNALAKLNSIEGALALDNGQSTTATPGSGTLTVSSGGSLGLEFGSTLSITGNLSNSGSVFNEGSGTATTLTLSGTFTNNSGGFFQVGD